jgi:dTDP-4-dehydrorhamnose 3,5-epimerase
MRIRDTALEGVLVVEPDVFPDDRGCFLETWSDARYRALGIEGPFPPVNVF